MHAMLIRPRPHSTDSILPFDLYLKVSSPESLVTVTFRQRKLFSLSYTRTESRWLYAANSRSTSSTAGQDDIVSIFQTPRRNDSGVGYSR